MCTGDATLLNSTSINHSGKTYRWIKQYGGCGVTCTPVRGPGCFRSGWGAEGKLRGNRMCFSGNSSSLCWSQFTSCTGASCTWCVLRGQRGGKFLRGISVRLTGYQLTVSAGVLLKVAFKIFSGKRFGGYDCAECMSLGGLSLEVVGVSLSNWLQGREIVLYFNLFNNYILVVIV